ncbi:hypothetical protein [Streptomyces sp. NPDC006552]|uniref:hypothetical protein n=1 Tax=Streptomyces sp. NPDC006552 TaxID=3157179 RepID=UPI00339DAF06
MGQVAPAHASGGLELAACTLAGSTETTDYSPALTSARQSSTVSIDTQYRNCLAPTEPALSSGSRSSVFTRETSCLDLANGGQRTYTIDWNTGQQSTLSGMSTANVVGAVLTTTTTGTVTSGLFQGATFIQQVVSIPNLNITLCTVGAGSLAHLDNTVTLVITGV